MAGGGGNKQKRVKEGRVAGREAESGKRGGAGWGGDRDNAEGGVCQRARLLQKNKRGGRCLRPGDPWRLGTVGESQARPFHVTQLVFVGGFGKGKPPGW